MNSTKVPFSPFKSAKENHSLELVSFKLNSGATVPSGIIFEAVFDIYVFWDLSFKNALFKSCEVVF
jgi:hypothetical protein